MSSSRESQPVCVMPPPTPSGLVPPGLGVPASSLWLCLFRARACPCHQDIKTQGASESYCLLEANQASSGRKSASSQVILGARPGDWTVD